MSAWKKEGMDDEEGDELGIEEDDSVEDALEE